MRVAAVFVLISAALLGARQADDWRGPALKAFDEVWQTVNDTYHDPSFGGLNWNAVRTELRPAAAAAATPDAVRQVVRTMLARLGQSHFLLLTGGAPQAAAGDAVVAIDVRVTSDAVVVTRVEAGSPAARAGIRPGDRITSIDSQSVEEWRTSAEGDDRAKALDVWRNVFRALHGPARAFARLAVVNPSGAARIVAVERAREAGESVTVGNLPPFHVETRAVEVRTVRSKRVGVIGFNVWMTAINPAFEVAVDRFRASDGIVIDLRGNPGGLAEMIRGIAGHFLKTPELLGRVHTRTANLEFRANPRRSTADGRTVEPFAGPVAVLVDELSASASECFAGGLQSLGRARIFGSRTMGQALPAATRALSNGDVLVYAIGDFVTSTGVRLEGDGVVPDESVPLSIPALAAGRDPALEAALAWIDGR